MCGFGPDLVLLQFCFRLRSPVRNTATARIRISDTKTMATFKEDSRPIISEPIL